MDSLRVLITNMQMTGRSGTEMHVHDLAHGLLAAGHLPIVYTPKIGELGNRLIEQSIPVVDSLKQIAVVPDIIHGHHSIETMAAMLRFPNTPGIFVCHDCSAWHDRAPVFPRIRYYVAVDHACRDRLTVRNGIPASRVRLIQNGVDLSRFQPRSPLPATPRRALLISNYVTLPTLGKVRAACQQAGITLDSFGWRLGNVCEQPEEVLKDYDLVFAKGRCAWEAMAVGAAVIICDADGAGPMVTSGQVDEFADLNFGRRLLKDHVDKAHLLSQIQRYDANDAAQVSQMIRQRADLSGIVAQILDLYETTIDAFSGSQVSTKDELASASEYLEWWSTERENLIREHASRYRTTAVVRRLFGSIRKRIETSVYPRNAA